MLVKNAILPSLEEHEENDTMHVLSYSDRLQVPRLESWWFGSDTHVDEVPRTSMDARAVSPYFAYIIGFFNPI